MSDSLAELLREHFPAGVSLRRRPSRFGMLVDEAYPDPDYSTLENTGRLLHEDVPFLADTEVDRERVMSMVRWAFTARPTPWLEERRARLEQEAARRKRGTR